MVSLCVKSRGLCRRQSSRNRKNVEKMAFNVMFYRLLFLLLLVCLVKVTTAGNVNDGSNKTTTVKPTTNYTHQPTNYTHQPTAITTQPHNHTTPPHNHTTPQPHNHTTPQPHNHTTPQPHNYTTPQPTTYTTQPHNDTTPQPTTYTTAQPGNYTTVPPPSTVCPTAPSKDCKACEDKLKAEKHYKWVAVAFDIIFAILLIVMTILYLRQRKMYREMEGDGSLSRLI